MGIELFWDDDDESMFLIEVRDEWTFERLTAVMKTVRRLSEERGQIMGALLDLGVGLQLPQGGLFNANGLAQFQALLKLDSKQRGPLVIVGVNPLVRRIFDAAASLDPNATRIIDFAATLDEARTSAYATLRQLRAKIG